MTLIDLKDVINSNDLTVTAICDYCNTETSHFIEVDRYFRNFLQEHLFLCCDCYKKECEK